MILPYNLSNDNLIHNFFDLEGFLSEGSTHSNSNESLGSDSSPVSYNEYPLNLGSDTKLNGSFDFNLCQDFDALGNPLLLSISTQKIEIKSEQTEKCDFKDQERARPSSLSTNAISFEVAEGRIDEIGQTSLGKRKKE